MGWLHFLSTPGKYGFNILYLCSKRWNGKFQSDTMEHSLNILRMCPCFHNGSNFCYWPIPYYYLCFQQSSEYPRHWVIGQIPLQSNLVLLHVFSLLARWFCVMFEQSRKSFMHTYKNKKTNNQTLPPRTHTQNTIAFQVIIDSDTFGEPGFIYLTSLGEIFQRVWLSIIYPI